MHPPDDICSRFGFKRVINAMGMPTILGANTVAPEVRSAVDAALQLSVEIDELQAAACRVIRRRTGAAGGCVTSSCSAALAISAAAAMTGTDLAAISRLPDTAGLRNQVILPLAHDVNFGAPVSQMLRLSGAKPVHIGTASHFDRFHLRGALGEAVCAVFFVDSGDVNPGGSYLPLSECAEMAEAGGVPLIVDTAAGPDVRPFLEAGASLVLTSAHKQMGAPTSGMICGNLDLVRACYLQNYGIGRAMKVGKEGILGCVAAVESWYGRNGRPRPDAWQRISGTLASQLPVEPGSEPWEVAIPLPTEFGGSARWLANRLREGEPPVWVSRADDASRRLWMDLRVLRESDAPTLAKRILEALEDPGGPGDEPPYHDLYWSERRLLEWPHWP